MSVPGPPPTPTAPPTTFTTTGTRPTTAEGPKTTTPNNNISNPSPFPPSNSNSNNTNPFTLTTPPPTHTPSCHCPSRWTAAIWRPTWTCWPTWNPVPSGPVPACCSSSSTTTTPYTYQMLHQHQQQHHQTHQLRQQPQFNASHQHNTVIHMAKVGGGGGGGSPLSANHQYSKFKAEGWLESKKYPVNFPVNSHQHTIIPATGSHFINAPPPHGSKIEFWRKRNYWKMCAIWSLFFSQRAERVTERKRFDFQRVMGDRLFSRIFSIWIFLQFLVVFPPFFPFITEQLRIPSRDAAMNTVLGGVVHHLDFPPPSAHHKPAVKSSWNCENKIHFENKINRIKEKRGRIGVIEQFFTVDLALYPHGNVFIHSTINQSIHYWNNAYSLASQQKNSIVWHNKFA